MLHVQPQWQLGTEVGVDQSLISRIFNKFVDELLQRHSSKLYDNLGNIAKVLLSLQVDE